MKNQYVPDRNHIIWIDFEPSRGKEIGKYRPALVLSSKTYQKEKGLLICCPISTSIWGHITEIPVSNLGKPSIVVASMILTLSWQDRQVKFIREAEANVMPNVLQRLIPLIGADKVLLQNLNISSV